MTECSNHGNSLGQPAAHRIPHAEALTAARDDAGTRSRSNQAATALTSSRIRKAGMSPGLFFISTRAKPNAEVSFESLSNSRPRLLGQRRINFREIAQDYAFPNIKVELTTTKVGVPVLWWRSVGSTHTAYAVEVFVDELAEAAGKDPIAFRLALIKNHPRHVAALKLAAEKAGWGHPLPAGRFHGVAVAESFGTVVAEIAEISVENGEAKVHRVVCAVDCGIAINPDNVRAQMEGGIGFGLGAILKSKLTLDNGRIVEGNFDGYEVLRLDEMPAVEVRIVPSEAKPSGVGEPGVPPIGPAVANAFYQATKRRIRALPFKLSQNS
jgi:isoquinoline 1-oxidoreductase beta subunit